MKFKILSTLFALLSFCAHAETADRALTADVTGKLQAKAAVINVAAPKGTHLNYDGPWKLQFAGNQYGIADFDKTKHSFTLPLAGKPDSAEFKLAYFLCSDDNVWCKRVEAKGEIK